MGLFERYYKSAPANGEQQVTDAAIERLAVSSTVQADIDSLKSSILLNGRSWVNHDHHLFAGIVQQIKTEMMSQERVPPHDLEETVRNYIAAE